MPPDAAQQGKFPTFKENYLISEGEIAAGGNAAREHPTFNENGVIGFKKIYAKAYARGHCINKHIYAKHIVWSLLKCFYLCVPSI